MDACGHICFVLFLFYLGQATIDSALPGAQATIHGRDRAPGVSVPGACACGNAFEYRIRMVVCHIPVHEI